jgi:hypothetical protein
MPKEADKLAKVDFVFATEILLQQKYCATEILLQSALKIQNLQFLPEKKIYLAA